MQHRIFIAINLPEGIKNELENFQRKFSELPARWVKKENLHITLSFLGYLKDENLPKIIEITKKVVERHSSFSLNLTKICYVPAKALVPRMIWVVGEKSEKLANLQNDLKGALMTISIPQLEEEEKSFVPHITLARIKKWEFKRMEPEEIPEIDEEINLKFVVRSVEIMESHLKKGGPKYEILQSFLLKE